MTQTILGAGGAIGIPLAKELKKYTDQIRLVGRSPKKVNEGDKLVAMDVNKPGEIDKAIEGSEVVYEISRNYDCRWTFHVFLYTFIPRPLFGNLLTISFKLY